MAQFSGAFPCLAIGLGLGSLSMLIVSRFMPAKSVKGAEAAAKWNAFRDYLKQLEKLEEMDNVGEIFEQYLPYAIAFGMNQSFVNKFSRVTDTPAPGWYIPFPRRGLSTSGGGRGLAGDFAGGGRGLAGDFAGGARSGSGGLQSMSESMGGGLQSMSDGLTTMLNSAGRIMRSAPSSSGSSGGGFSGGGFSGGGFSGGGGGGGGGRGFG
jgi:hypothetical protein